MSKPTETELLPCPWCGHKPLLTDNGFGDDIPAVRCMTQSCVVQRIGWVSIATWNTRTPSLSDAQARESLTIEQARKQAEAILFQVFPPVRNIHSDSALAELRQLIALALVSASGLSTPQPTLSDAVQAESDAYAQGYQDGTESQL